MYDYPEIIVNYPLQMDTHQHQNVLDTKKISIFFKGKVSHMTESPCTFILSSHLPEIIAYLGSVPYLSHEATDFEPPDVLQKVINSPSEGCMTGGELRRLYNRKDQSSNYICNNVLTNSSTWSRPSVVADSYLDQ
jgi:hypothetical protein